MKHRETQLLDDLTYMWNLKNKKQTKNLIDTENRLVVARGGGVRGG